MNLVYGMDFGTTNFAISILKNGVPEILPIRLDGGKIDRTVLFFSEKDNAHFVGEEAIQQYIKSGMKGRFIRSLKSILPVPYFQGTWIYGTKYTAEDLVELVLRHFKNRADQLTGQVVTSVVMGRPVYFSQDPENDKLAQDRLATAASRVGFDQIVFQLEPVAAALYFETMLTIPQLVLVADLGGGTTDLTLMKMSPEKVKTANRHQDVLATNGVYIGGDKFDSEIMRHKLVKYFGSEAKWSSYNKWMDMPVHIMSTICDWREIPYLKGGMERRMIRELKHTSNDRDALERLEALIDEDLGFALFQEIENAKTAISSKKSCLIKFKHSIIEIKELVTRLEFNQMIGKYLREIEKCLHELLYRARVSVDDVDKVFLTGGSSNVPAVYELFASTIGSNKVQLGDALTSVVAGLVLSSNMTSGT